MSSARRVVGKLMLLAEAWGGSMVWRWCWGSSWLSPSGEGDRAREEWGPVVWFFPSEDFEFAGRVL